MRICIDARVSRSWDAGTGRLTLALLEGMAREGPQHEYVVLLHRHAAPPPITEPERFQVERSGPTNGLIGQHALFGVWARARRIDVAFHPHQHALPLWPGVPSVGMVLDLLPLLFPDQFSRFHVVYYRTIIRHAAPRQDALLVISQATRDDVTRHFGMPADRVDVLPLAPAAAMRAMAPAEARAVLTRFDLSRPFVLYVGNARAHKNLGGLLDAFCELKLQTQWNLVIVGRENPGESERDYRPWRSRMDALGLTPAVRFIGAVSDRELAALYSTTSALALVSFYEGFGLPVLEGMACGAPVVASRAGALPEVAGDAAVFVDPTDTHSIAEGLRLVLFDAPQTAARRAAAIARAAQFSWTDSARQLLAALERVAA